MQGRSQSGRGLRRRLVVEFCLHLSLGSISNQLGFVSVEVKSFVEMAQISFQWLGPVLFNLGVLQQAWSPQVLKGVKLI